MYYSFNLLPVKQFSSFDTYSSLLCFNYEVVVFQGHGYDAPIGTLGGVIRQTARRSSIAEQR